MLFRGLDMLLLKKILIKINLIYFYRWQNINSKQVVKMLSNLTKDIWVWDECLLELKLRINCQNVLD
jgi:hypothetical protein